jgi:hypothetical protein
MATQTYLVGYDLRKPGQDYSDLFDAIKAASDGNWWHCLDSTWMIRSSSDATQIANALLAWMDANDKLLVVPVIGAQAAWYGFTGDCYDWLMTTI